MCTPYNGEDLVWHPVTPSMSSMSYQSPDSSQNVELKKGNIASFFKSGAKTPKASNSTSAAADIKAASSQAGQRADTVKLDVADGHRGHLKASSANQASHLATGTLGQHDKSQEGGTGQGECSQSHSSHQTAGLPITHEDVGAADKHVGKQEPADGDVLNTDDAGGIGALYLLHTTAFVQFLRKLACQLQDDGIKVQRSHVACHFVPHHVPS